MTAATHTQTPARRISTLERQLREADDRLGRLHTGMRLVHELIQEAGSLNAAGRLVARWCRVREDSAQRVLRALWDQGQPPSLELIQRLAATVQRDRLDERVERVRQHAARIDATLAEIDAAEAGTRADRLDSIG